MASTIKNFWWQITLLVAVSVLSVYAGLSLDERIQGFVPEVRIFPSIFNKRQTGLSALYEVAQQANLPCMPWQKPYRELTTANGILIIVSPSVSISQAELEQILKWVKRGNELIFLDDFLLESSRAILRTLNLHLVEGTPVSDAGFAPTRPIREFAHVTRLTVSARTRVHGGRPLIEDEHGSLLTELDYGKGRILLGTVPGFCSNAAITNSQYWPDFQFLLNWFDTAHGSIMFDERCHGFSSSSNLFYFLLGQPPGYVFCQLMLILAIAVVSQHQRFGQVQLHLQKRKSSNLQFIEGFANTYQRAGGGLAALEIIVQDFRVWLCRQLNVSPHAADADLVQALGVEQPETAVALQGFFQSFERLSQKKTISAHDLVQQVRTSDLLKDKIQSILAR
jgi:Domain of unknown function (DUF4350)